MMQTNRGWAQSLALVAIVAGLAAATVSCGMSNGSSGDAEWRGGEVIPLGSITALSGPTSPAYAPFADGVTARIEYQNQLGGVNGRKFELFGPDDASDPSRNLAAARELVEGRDVVGIVETSSYTGGGADYLEKNGIAVTGYATSRDFFTRSNVFPYSNTSARVSVDKVTNSLWGQYINGKGGTILYSLGSGEQSGALAATAIIKSAESVGISVGGLTTNLPVGTMNYSGEAQRADKSGADSIAASTIPTQSLTFLNALKQAGVDPKVVLLTDGYDLAVPKSGNGLDGASIAIPFASFELSLPAHQTYKDAMAKYADATHVGQLSMGGWLGADLMVKAIEATGGCPSRANILKAIPKITDYTADGLIPSTNFNEGNKGGPPSCGYFVTVENQQFVRENNGEPLCITDPKEVPLA